jgi:hypothetical protein
MTEEALAAYPSALSEKIHKLHAWRRAAQRRPTRSAMHLVEQV